MNIEINNLHNLQPLRQQPMQVRHKTTFETTISNSLGIKARKLQYIFSQ